MDFRIGHGYDVHALGEGLRLVLGGVEIPHDKGCIAHSDGDVLVHAICDALLGALALGDIGKLFPDSDAKYKGIDSRLLLKEVVELIASEGYAISNIGNYISNDDVEINHNELLKKKMKYEDQMEKDFQNFVKNLSTKR